MWDDAWVTMSGRIFWLPLSCLLRRLKQLSTYISVHQPNFPLLRRGGPHESFFSSSCCSSSSSSSSSCFSEKHDRPHLYYHITLWASIKKKRLFMPAPSGWHDKYIMRCEPWQTRVMTIQLPSVQRPTSSILGVRWAVRCCPEGLASHLKSRFRNKCAVKLLITSRSAKVFNSPAYWRFCSGDSFGKTARGTHNAEKTR